MTDIIRCSTIGSKMILPPRRFPADRFCPDCGTRLSVYNKDDKCALHVKWYIRPRISERERGDTYIDVEVASKPGRQRINHGYSAYSLGCRCDECVIGARIAKREERERKLRVSA